MKSVPGDVGIPMDDLLAGVRLDRFHILVSELGAGHNDILSRQHVGSKIAA